MDVVLQVVDHYCLTPYVYPVWWKEENVWRQLLSLNLIADLGGLLLYISTASLSYALIFDKRLLKHPLMLEVRFRYNQTPKEFW